jgi:hypothetical protein
MKLSCSGGGGGVIARPEEHGEPVEVGVGGDQPILSRLPVRQVNG